MFLNILRFIHSNLDEIIIFPLMYCTLLYVNLNSSYDELKKLVQHFTGDTQTTFSTICGILVNGAIFLENIEKISRIFLRSISRNCQNTNV